MTTSIMRTTVLGFSVAEGISNKSGQPKPYSIGKLFVMYPLTGQGVGGYQGAELSAEPMLVRKLEGIQLPCEVDIETANVMRYGKLQQQIMAVAPVANAKAKAV